MVRVHLCTRCVCGTPLDYHQREPTFPTTILLLFIFSLHHWVRSLHLAHRFFFSFFALVLAVEAFVVSFLVSVAGWPCCQFPVAVRQRGQSGGAGPALLASSRRVLPSVFTCRPQSLARTLPSCCCSSSRAACWPDFLPRLQLPIGHAFWTLCTSSLRNL